MIKIHQAQADSTEYYYIEINGGLIAEDCSKEEAKRIKSKIIAELWGDEMNDEFWDKVAEIVDSIQS